MKKYFLPCFLLFVFSTAQGCAFYLYGLGREQFRIIRNRVPIEEALTLASFSNEEKSKLLLVKEAKDFGVQVFGLSSDSGFSYVTKLDREEIGWNVSASEELQLKSITWWFPVAGEVPYKGFFDKNLAEEEEESLKSKGFDTKIRPIGGYSTLGWFSDPVLSPQLKWESHRLVGLVFHEMAHATNYRKGESTWNESYASFVEDKASIKFFETTDRKKWLEAWEREKKQKKVSLDILKQFAKELDTLYNSPITSEAKRERKKTLIQECKNALLSTGLVPPDKGERFLKKEWNNEDFLGAFLYHSLEKELEALWVEANQDPPRFHELAKRKSP